MSRNKAKVNSNGATSEGAGVSKGSKRVKAVFNGFADDTLTSADKEYVKANVLTADQALDWINTQVELGYKVSFSYSAEGSFSSCTAYGAWSDMDNAGRSLTARHSDLLIAVSTLRHLMENVYDAGKWERVDVYDW